MKTYLRKMHGYIEIESLRLHGWKANHESKLAYLN